MKIHSIAFPFIERIYWRRTVSSVLKYLTDLKLCVLNNVQENKKIVLIFFSREWEFLLTSSVQHRWVLQMLWTPMKFSQNLRRRHFSSYKMVLRKIFWTCWKGFRNVCFNHIIFLFLFIQNHSTNYCLQRLNVVHIIFSGNDHKILTGPIF